MSITDAQLVAGLLGLLAGIFSRTGKFWWERRTRREKLRAALLAEVQSPKSTINDAAEATTPSDFNPTHNIIPTQVYDSQIEDIGLLCSHEVRHIVDYYSIAEVAEQQLESIVEKEASGKTFIEETAAGLKDARDDAEDALRDHSKIAGCKRYSVKQWRS